MYFFHNIFFNSRLIASGFISSLLIFSQITDSHFHYYAFFIFSCMMRQRGAAAAARRQPPLAASRHAGQDTADSRRQKPGDSWIRQLVKASCQRQPAFMMM